MSTLVILPDVKVKYTVKWTEGVEPEFNSDVEIIGFYRWEDTIAFLMKSTKGTYKVGVPLKDIESITISTE